ncbi:MAG: PfkB family carbohydrate kinase [Acidobacteriota bacterium]
MKIIILEFAPCADTIYHIRQDADEGYITGDRNSLSIRTGVKLRPQVVSYYAGGKATNVARVLDRLLTSEDIAVELVVFRPDSPEGRYIHELQTGALDRVRVRPIIISGRARFCIDLTDPRTDPQNRVEFNISPRAVWETGAIETALEFASALSADALIMAGNPPTTASGQQSAVSGQFELAVELYARVIESVRHRVGVISIDTEKLSLARCLESTSKPDAIKINAAEYASVDERLWNDFEGTLIVTDASGCLVRETRIETRLEGAAVERLYSTVGAGDAVHAGFILARWGRGFDARRAARYGLAAAAAAVSSPEGTRDVNRQQVERLFAEMEKGT